MGTNSGGGCSELKPSKRIQGLVGVFTGFGVEGEQIARSEEDRFLECWNWQ